MVTGSGERAVGDRSYRPGHERFQQTVPRPLFPCGPAFAGHRELSAGPKPLRENFRAQHRPERVLAPPPGVGTQAGTVGTAIDQRLRLAFTAAAPVDDASMDGIDVAATMGGPEARERMRTVGAELVELLDAMAGGLALDDRDQDPERAQDEEEQLPSLSEVVKQS